MATARCGIGADVRRRRCLFAMLAFCCAAQSLIAQERSLVAEITPQRKVVKIDEIFPVAVVVRNVGSTEQSLTVWDCSYPAQWLASNPAVHALAVPCKQNVPAIKRLKPGESFGRTVSLYVHSPSGRPNGAKVTFRMGYGERAYFGTQNFSPKVPLFWSNAVTVLVTDASPPVR